MSINGKKYSAENVQISLAGKPLAAASGINYNTETEHTEVYTIGRQDPYAIVDNTAKHSAEIILLHDEYEALQRSIPAGKAVTSIAGFDIVVVYQAADGSLMRDVLKNCRFKSVAKEWKANELSTEMTFPLSVASIEYNV